MRNRVRRIVGLLLLFLFMGYYGSTTLFLHTHHYAFGDVTHSHPFSNAAHEHNASQAATLSILSRVVVDTVFGSIFISAILLLLFQLGHCQKASIALVPLAIGYDRRGPPVR